MKNEWIEFKGTDENKCPIPEYLWCEILMLDSEVFADFAGEFNWSDLGDWGGNIVAYRIPELVDAELKIYKEEAK